MTATVDIDEVVSYRGAISSLQEQASGHQPHPHIPIDFCICHSEAQPLIPTTPREPFYHRPEEEIALGTGSMLDPECSSLTADLCQERDALSLQQQFSA